MSIWTYIFIFIESYPSKIGTKPSSKSLINRANPAQNTDHLKIRHKGSRIS